MSHNSRIKPPGTWALNDLLQPSDVEQIDQGIFEAVNGDQGGVWAPSSVLELGGAGLKVTGVTELTGALSATGLTQILGPNRIVAPEGTLLPDAVILGVGYSTLTVGASHRAWKFGAAGPNSVTLSNAGAVVGDRMVIRWDRVSTAAPVVSVSAVGQSWTVKLAPLGVDRHHCGEFRFDGTGWQPFALSSWFDSPTGPVELVAFTTPGSFAWSAPATIRDKVLVHVTACGAGGGGGGGANNLLTEPTSGGGGGGGQLSDGWALLAAGDTLTCVVPAGGGGGTQSGGLGTPGGLGGTATVTGPGFSLAALGGSGGAGGGASLGGFSYGTPGGPNYPVPGGTFLNAGWLIPPFVAPGHGGWGRRTGMGGSLLPCHGGAQRGFAGGASPIDVSGRASGGGGGAGPLGAGGFGSSVGLPASLQVVTGGGGGGGGAIHVAGDGSPHEQGGQGGPGRITLVVHHTLPGVL